MYDRLDKKKFSIVQKYEYDVKVSRTRTFVRGQRRTKVRPCGRTLSYGAPFILLSSFLDTVFRIAQNPLGEMFCKMFCKNVLQNVSQNVLHNVLQKVSRKAFTKMFRKMFCERFLSTKDFFLRQFCLFFPIF